MSKKKTFGSLLLETNEEHQKNFDAEAGEVVNAFGPKYMTELNDAAEKHSYLKEVFYIQILSKHIPLMPNRGMQLTFFVRRSKPLMEPNEDVWSVTPVSGKLELLWSLPHRHEMGNILRNSDQMCPKLVNDIDKYLKSVGVKLKKI